MEGGQCAPMTNEESDDEERVAGGRRIAVWLGDGNERWRARENRWRNQTECGFQNVEQMRRRSPKQKKKRGTR